MIKILKLILSAEMFFVLFLFSGSFKEMFPNTPIDLTVLFMALTMIAAIKRIVFKKSVNKKPTTAFVMYFIFAIIVLFSLLYTQSNFYYVEKAVKFFVFTTWAFVCPLLLLSNKASMNKFIYSLSLFSTLSAAIVVRNYFFNTAVNTNFVGLVSGGSSYLSSARLIGSGAITLLCLYLYKTDINKKGRMLLFISLMLSLTALISTGARMPVVAFVLTFIAITFFKIKIGKRKIISKKGTKRLIGLFVLMIPGIIYIKDMSFAQTFIKRFEVLFEGGGTSALGRVNRFDTALEMMSENIVFGGGFGSYGLNHEGFDIRSYPHNLFLEAGAELGLLGLLVITILILYLLISVIKNMKKDSYIYSVVFGLFVFHFINAMSSGDFNDNRVFFSILGIASLYTSYSIVIKRRDTYKQKSEITMAH